MRLSVETMDVIGQSAIVGAWERLRPHVLPADWLLTELASNAGWFRSRDGMKALLAVESIDGELWLHLSYSRKDRIPNWHDTRRVKSLFIGGDRKAVIVLPKEDEYYDFHPRCLHLYACIYRDPLPDFRDHLGRL